MFTRNASCWPGTVSKRQMDSLHDRSWRNLTGNPTKINYHSSPYSRIRKSFKRDKTKLDGRVDHSIEGTTEGYTDGVEEKPEGDEGQWGKFRRLVSYYRRCVKNEEGAESIAFLNQHLEKYIFLLEFRVSP